MEFEEWLEKNQMLNNVLLQLTSKVILIVVLITISTFTSYSQSEIDLKHRIDFTKSTAYVSFEKIGKRPPSVEGESDEGIWLRFHNNSKLWNMSVFANSIDKIYGDYRVFYGLIADDSFKGEIPKSFKRHVGFAEIIEPGKSFVFSLPKEHLAEGLTLTFEFGYEWEIGGNSGGNAPNITHQVLFPYFDYYYKEGLKKYQKENKTQKIRKTQ